MDDIISLLNGSVDPTTEQMQALASALRGEQGRGRAVQLLSSFGGGNELLNSDALGRYGSGLAQSADEQAKELAAVPRLRQAMALQKQQTDKGALDAQKERAQMDLAKAPAGPLKQAMMQRMAALGGVQLPDGQVSNEESDRSMTNLEKLASLEEQAKSRRLVSQSRGDAKASDELSKQLQKLKDDLDPNKGRGSNFVFNQRKVDTADRLTGLINDSHGNVRNLDQRQIEELAIGAQNLLSGSSGGAAGQVAALVPHTAMGNATKLVEWLTNEPTGTNQLAFIKRMAETIDREKSIAQGQIRSGQIQRLSTYNKLRKEHPDEVNDVLRSYGIDPDTIDEHGRLKPTNAPTGEKHTAESLNSLFGK